MKLLISFLFLFSSYSFAYQVQLKNYNGYLDEGKGTSNFERVFLDIGPLKATLVDQALDFEMVEKRLIFTLPGQEYSLDLGRYYLLFINQSFEAKSVNASVDSGKKVDASFNSVSAGIGPIFTKAIKGNISCEKTSGRNFGREVLELCLDKGYASLDRLELGLDVQEELRKATEKSNLVNELPAISTLVDFILAIEDKKYSLSSKVNLVFMVSLISDGNIVFNKSDDQIEITPKTLKLGKFSIKAPLLTVLSNLDSDIITVKGGTIIIRLSNR